MAKLQPLDDKDFEAKSGTYFRAGVHEVFIKSARRDKTPNTGTEYIELTVEGDDGEGTVTLWISEKAAPYTLARLAQVAVHNKATEEDKQKVRDAFKKIDDTDKIDQEFLDKFKDMQCWILTEEDTTGKQKPDGGYYLRNNLYAYEPKPRKTTVEDIMGKGTPVDNDDVPFGDS